VQGNKREYFQQCIFVLIMCCHVLLRKKQLYNSDPMH
jgi:hypothetical protein